MIKENEIRVGNLIKGIATSLTIKVDLHFFNEVFDDDTMLDWYAPIPLSKELLEKCGFVKNRSGELAIEMYGAESHLEMIYGVESWHYPIITQTPQGDEERSVFLNRIQYLHQLQNLYFALVGEELKIEL